MKFYSPNFSVKTKIENAPENQTIKFGKTTPFRCQANTDPAEQQNLQYTWLKDGEPVDFTNNPRIKQRGSDIIIENSTSEDTGNYTCVANNGLDSDTASAKLNVIGNSFTFIIYFGKGAFHFLTILTGQGSFCLFVLLI